MSETKFYIHIEPQAKLSPCIFYFLSFFFTADEKTNKYLVGSIIITSLNPTDFTNSANKILRGINKWFTTNLLSLNADKTQYMQFVTKTSSLIDLHVMYKNREIANTCNSTFLGLTLDNDRLCGLVVRVPGYRSRGPSSIPSTALGLERGPHSFMGAVGGLLERKSSASGVES
jgi:hypothetical protein